MLEQSESANKAIQGELKVVQAENCDYKTKVHSLSVIVGFLL